VSEINTDCAIFRRIPPKAFRRIRIAAEQARELTSAGRSNWHSVMPPGWAFASMFANALGSAGAPPG